MLITETQSLRPFVNKGINEEMKQEYRELEKWFSSKYGSCGTNVHSKLYSLPISVTKKADKLANKENWHWANDYFISALFYTSTTTSNAQKLFNSSKKWNTCYLYQGSWLEAHVPLVLIYSKSDLINLVNENKAEYYHLAKDSTTYIFSNPYSILGEYAIKPEHEPIPLFLLIGKAVASRPKEERNSFLTDGLSRLQNLYPSSTIIHAPNLPLKAVKQTDETGTEKTSGAGLKFLRYLKQIGV